MLLTALGAERAQLAVPAEPVSPNRPKSRWFRVRVSDTATGRVKVNINMPMSLVDFGLKMGGIAGFDAEELRTSLQQSEGGKLIDVLDEEDGEHVEIFVE